jgi:hypothetical protein|tara:strand:+ start:156 stop:518 length:363 start_codon:yes stop_codon:yes gene_type:complete
MSKDFIELNKNNLPSGKMNSGKIIKGARVKVLNKTRVISNDNDAVKLKPKLPSNTEVKQDKTFTFDPKYNNKNLEELGVKCSCGNKTKIIFNKEDNLSEVDSIDQIQPEEPKEIIQPEEN